MVRFCVRSDEVLNECPLSILSKQTKQGGAFKGRIFATHPTKAIMRLMLQNHIRTDSLRYV